MAYCLKATAITPHNDGITTHIDASKHDRKHNASLTNAHDHQNDVRNCQSN